MLSSLIWNGDENDSFVRDYKKNIDIFLANNKTVGALSLAASSWCESSPETGCAVDCGREIEDHNPQSQALFLSFKCELFTLIVH